MALPSVGVGSRLRCSHYLRFALLGLVGSALQYGALQLKNAPSSPWRDPLPIIEVSAGLSATGRQQLTDKLLLADLALNTPQTAADVVVVERLVSSMRMVEPDLPAALALRRAQRYGLQRADPVVFSRLVSLGAQLLSSAKVEPSKAELEAFLQTHAAEFGAPESVALTQVFLSRQRWGPKLAGAAAEMQSKLKLLLPKEALTLGDPSLLPSREPLTPLSRLSDRYGAQFAAGVLEAAPNRWSEPIASPFGLHFVWVTSRRTAAAPALADVVNAVRASYRRQASAARLKRGLTELRRHYQIVMTP